MPLNREKMCVERMYVYKSNGHISCLSINHLQPFHSHCCKKNSLLSVPPSYIAILRYCL